ncbi:hypothetical protein BES36_001350 [Haemophilus quentini]|nr:hypothetical protein BES36_001350 [Haemophilus quentini]
MWWIILYFSRFILSRKIFIKINRTLIFLNIHKKVRSFFTLFYVFQSSNLIPIDNLPVIQREVFLIVE